MQITGSAPDRRARTRGYDPDIADLLRLIVGYQVPATPADCFSVSRLLAPHDLFPRCSERFERIGRIFRVSPIFIFLHCILDFYQQ